MIAPATQRLSFGPFQLFPAERRLERDGAPVRLGGRALDLLVALAEAAGEVVSKKTLLARVWPDTIVEEGSLRFHLVALRKALTDGGSGSTYITNIAGRGYSFVFPVIRSDGAPPAAGNSTAAPPTTPSAPSVTSSRTLPASAASVVGRGDAISVVVAQLRQRRFVTIVGPGGIGKTTVAIAAAHALVASFGGDVVFADLSLIDDPALVAPTLAAAMGLTLRPDDSTAGLAEHLAHRRTLLVLDCCEHVIDSVAALTERLVRDAPQVHVLVTSREALRVDGEYVHRLAPLDYPSATGELSAQQALSFSAVRLFVDRAASSGSDFVLSDADAPLVAKLCRELDGIALAIELAAGRLEAYGLRGIVDLLDRRIKLMWHGRRTAVPRQQTLGATLDWSHNLLTEVERTALRRVSVFVGGFSLEAAAFVVAGQDIPIADAAEAIGNLVGKSLLNVDAGGATLRYMLLDTTRAYASGKLLDSGETEEAALRHARYFASWLQGRTAASGTDRDAETAEVGNLRVALATCFTDGRNPALGCELAAGSARIFLARSLLVECTTWVSLALRHLPADARGTLHELDLETVLGQALTFTGGDRLEVERAFARALEIASALQDNASRFRILNSLAMARHRAGDFRGALETARQAETTAAAAHDADNVAIADSMLGVALHMVGQVAEADRRWQRVIVYGASADRLATTARFGFDHHVRALCGRARSLWLQGEHPQATACALRAIDEAERLGHPATLCIALIWAGAVFVWQGDLPRIAEVIEKLSMQAQLHSLGPYLAVAQGLKGQLLIQQGHPDAAVALLGECLRALRSNHYEMLSTTFVITLAQALSDAGQQDDAVAAITEAMRRIDSGGDLFHLPEALRMNGSILARRGEPDQAAALLAQAAELAASQGARPWELRALAALAEVRDQQGSVADAGSIGLAG